MSKSFAVIGGGIIGLAVAHKLGAAYPDGKIAVLEKESRVCRHQSGHNSGVLHAGLYYKPGSLKARLAVSGIRQMKAFCREHSIAHEECGKLVVASSGEETGRLRDLLDRGTRNGLQGLRWLGPQEMPEFEPHVAGTAALWVPEEGIVDYSQVCETLTRLIERAGGVVHTGFEVRRLLSQPAGWVVQGSGPEQQANFIFNCAGLYCDRILAAAGEPRLTRIVPFRGEYYSLNEQGRKLVRNLIYPVPDPRLPFLGVHFTRMIHGGVEAGPNAVLALAREGYRKTSFNMADAMDVFSFGGFWRFLARYPSIATYELRRSLSMGEFCRSLQRLVPELRREHLGPGGAGVRAQALAPDGALVQDFEIVLRNNALHLINAPSPGATASLAIADYLLALASPALQ
jgi:L-2-hydroxyglutarate oxidase